MQQPFCYSIGIYVCSPIPSNHHLGGIYLPCQPCLFSCLKCLLNMSVHHANKLSVHYVYTLSVQYMPYSMPLKCTDKRSVMTIQELKKKQEAGMHMTCHMPNLPCLIHAFQNMPNTLTALLLQQLEHCVL